MTHFTLALLAVFRRLAVPCLAAALALAAMTPARADESSALPDAAGLTQFLGGQLAGPKSAAIGRRVSIDVGTLDPRLTLRACAHVEPFMPASSRAWGKTHVGIRCNERGGWTVFVPVDVHVYGRVAVANRPLAPGQSVLASDFTFEERDLTRIAGDAVADAAQVSDRVLARSVSAGQPILATALRAQPVLANGDPVRVMVGGAGFAIEAAGVALSQAEDGASVRVRLESGRFVQGIAREGRVVQVKL